MGADDDGAAGLVLEAKLAGEPVASRGVEASGGLVEEEEAGSMQQRAGDGQALAHSAGKGADEVGSALGESGSGEAIGNACGRVCDAVEASEELEILLGGQLVVEHGGVGDDAEARDRDRRRARRKQFHATGGGAGEESGQAKESGFAGAVWAEQDDEFARSDFKVGGAKGADGAVALFDGGKAEADAGGLG